MTLELPPNALRGLVDYGFRRGRLSYSGSGEDLIVEHAFAEMGIRRPRYIDIGAFHPFFASNTARLHLLGSRGINIEPDPLQFRAFLKYRKGDVNLNLGVSDVSGEMDFYRMTPEANSTFSKDEAEKRIARGTVKLRDVIKVPVRTLNELYAQHASPEVPRFMSLDAEGLDERILRSFDFGSWAPTVLCVETIAYPPTPDSRRSESLIDFIRSKGYRIYAETWANTILVLEAAWKTRS